MSRRVTPARRMALSGTSARAISVVRGAFVIIVLGETLTGVVTGSSGEPVGVLTLAVGLVAVVVGFGAWWTYFDFAGGRRPRPERSASLQWMLGHLPLTAAIATMGAAMLSLVDHAHDGRTPAATAWLLCAGTAVVLGATMLLAASLPAWTATDSRTGRRPHVRGRGRGVPGPVPPARHHLAPAKAFLHSQLRDPRTQQSRFPQSFRTNLLHPEGALETELVSSGLRLRHGLARPGRGG